MTPAAVTVDLGHPDTAAAEHWLAGMGPAPVWAWTHLVREPVPHVALSLVFTEERPDELPEGARAVLYPGVQALTGDLPTEEIIGRSAIGRVEVLGGEEASAVVRTGGFVRPVWRGGTLVLVTMPAADGLLVPFETRHPTPCCAAH